MIRLKEALSRVDIALSDNQVLLFQKYLDLIESWNKRTNLVSRQDERRLVERHVLESVAVLATFDIHQQSKIIDIGSGAGFPALPIRFLRPDLSFLLVESKRLKALFLKEVVSQLKLDRVAIACERAELLQNDPIYRSRFDVAFSRAVASVDVIYKWSSKLLKPGGSLVCWKGGDISNEIELLHSAAPNLSIAIKKMDARLVNPARDKKIVQIQIVRV